jgi:hypothetical protein
MLNGSPGSPERRSRGNGDFAKLVSDIPDSTRQQGIAYAGGRAERIAVLDSGLVVVMGLDGSVRVHRVPGS